MTSPLDQMPRNVAGPLPGQRSSFFATLAQAIRSWTPRQVMAAVIGAVVVALVIGIATVLIPNPVFARDIPPVWWNYPVWLLTSVLSGILVATYVRPTSPRSNTTDDDGASQAAAATEQGEAAAASVGASGQMTDGAGTADRSERRTSRMGMAGGVLAWFAVGCPVCNKIALLALGYSGAITYFTPIQPFLAVGAMVLTGIAVVVRLRGQVSCPLPARRAVSR